MLGSAGRPGLLRIALLSPHPLPPVEDVAHHVLGEAEALAGRGHAVTILTPSADRSALAAGRRRIEASAADDGASLRAEPGQVLTIAIGRIFRAGGGRRIGGPIDVARNLETALATGGFDVAHLHEPLSPSPALAALRRHAGVRATTFHRPEFLAGAAFLRPLITPSLADLDLRIASSPAVLAQVAEVLPGEYRLVPGGVDGGRVAAAAAVPRGRAMVVVARHRERAGLRFGLAVARALIEDDPALRIGLIGPAEGPWRTRAAIPRAVRDRIEILDGERPADRIAAFADAHLAIFAAPAETAGPALAEAMACGAIPLVPRQADSATLVADGRDGRTLVAFSRAEWAAAARDLLASGETRARLAEAARATGAGYAHERAAATLEAAYLAARRASPRATRDRGAGEPTVLADLRVRPDPRIAPEDLIAAAERIGLGAIAIAAPGGIAPALAVAALAPPGLAVIIGQEVASAQGTLVGLFLTDPIEDGLGARTTLARIHAQGGVTLVPHPAAAGVPPADVLHQLVAAIDCFEVLCGQPDAGPQPEATPALIQRLGIPATAGSGARAPEEIGTALTRLRPFHSAGDFLRALTGAELLHGRQVPRNARRAGAARR